MGQFEAATTVDADLPTVWAFHDDLAGLIELTPSWMRPEIRVLEGAVDDSLSVGTVFELVLRPFGIGHTSRILARIDEREVTEERVELVDSMIDGPFPEWRHRHVLTAVDGGTKIVDSIEYREPAIARRTVDGTPYILEAVFRYRHRRLRSMFGGVEAPLP